MLYLLQYLFLLLISVFFFYLTGHLIISPIKKESNLTDEHNVTKSILIKFFIGVLFVVGLYAIIVTYFKTVLIGLFLMFIAYFILNKQKLYFSISNIKLKKREVLQLLKFIPFFIIAFLLYYFILFDISGNIKQVHWDFAFWGGIADSFNRFHIESYYLDVMEEAIPLTPNMYHYFEIWTSALYSKVFGYTGTKSLLLFTYPLFTGLYLLGVYGLIAENLKFKSMFITIGISLLILLLSPISYKVGQITTIGSGIILLNKLTIVYLSIIVSLYFRKHLLSFSFLFSLTALLYLNSFPALLGGLGIFLLLLLIVKRIEFKEFLKNIVFVVTPLLFILLFYGFNASDNAGSTETTDMYISYYLNENGIVRFLELFINRSIKYTLACLPFGLFYFMFFRKKKNIKNYSHYVFLIFSVAFAGLFTSCVMHINSNSGQIFTNAVYPLWTILTFFLILFVFKDVGKKRKKAYILLVVYSIVLIGVELSGLSIKKSNLLNVDTINTLNKEISNTSKVAYIHPKEYYTEGSLSDYNFTFAIPFRSFRVFSDNYFPICLSIYEIPQNTYKEKAYIGKTIENSIFYNYHKNNIFSRSIYDSQVSFLREYRFNYLITYKGVVFDTKHLPVVAEFEFNNERYKMYKFNWNKKE